MICLASQELTLPFLITPLLANCEICLLEYLIFDNKHIFNSLLYITLLQLKLKAELGVEAHISANTPASIENIFLKNMLAFEKGLAEAEEINIFELIGKPDFVPETKLDDLSVEAALNKIIDHL